MFTALFWKQALERALKSAGQFGAGALGAVVFTNVEQVIAAGSLVGFAMLFGFVASGLTSMASAPIGDKGTPSLVSYGDGFPEGSDGFTAG